MSRNQRPRVESENLGAFGKFLNTRDSIGKKNGENKIEAEFSRDPERRLNLNQDDLKNGLGQLVLTLVKLLHELLERQALERIRKGSLNDHEIEGLGVTLMKQAEEIERLRKAFNLDEDDLDLELGPLGTLL